MNIRIFCLLPTLLIHSIYTMDLQEPANNQQENTQQVSTLRQRRNTNNASPKPLPATTYSSIFAESPRSIETIQSTSMSIDRSDENSIQPKKITKPIFIIHLGLDIEYEKLFQKSFHFSEIPYRKKYEISPEAIHYSLLLQREVDNIENIEKENESIIGLTHCVFLKDTDLKLHFIAKLLNFIAQHKERTHQLPPYDIIRNYIQEETKNFTRISFKEINILLTYLKIPIARAAINTITPKIMQELSILFEQLRAEELRDKQMREIKQIQLARERS